MYQQFMAHRHNLPQRPQESERILYRLVLQANQLDDMCAHGFNQSHTDSACKIFHLSTTLGSASFSLLSLSLSLLQFLPMDMVVIFIVKQSISIERQHY